MQQLSTQSTSHQISSADRLALLDAKNSLIDGECLRPLKPDARNRLSMFMTITEQYWLPATVNQIDIEISALMISFRSARTVSRQEADAVVAAYFDVLRDLPLWAIKSGLRKIRMGEVAGISLDFPPAAPRVRTVVTEEMVPLRADRAVVKQVLAAREMPPENPVMAKRVGDLAKSGMNRMQQKFGKDYGLGHMGLSVDLPPTPRTPQTLSAEALSAYYRTHDLGGTPKPTNVGEQS